MSKENYELQKVRDPTNQFQMRSLLFEVNLSHIKMIFGAFNEIPGFFDRALDLVPPHSIFLRPPNLTLSCRKH